MLLFNYFVSTYNCKGSQFQNEQILISLRFDCEHRHSNYGAKCYKNLMNNEKTKTNFLLPKISAPSDTAEVAFKQCNLRVASKQISANSNAKDMKPKKAAMTIKIKAVRRHAEKEKAP